VKNDIFGVKQAAGSSLAPSCGCSCSRVAVLETNSSQNAFYSPSTRGCRWAHTSLPAARFSAAVLEVSAARKAASGHPASAPCCRRVWASLGLLIRAGCWVRALICSEPEISPETIPVALGHLLEGCLWGLSWSGAYHFGTLWAA